MVWSLLGFCKHFSYSLESLPVALVRYIAPDSRASSDCDLETLAMLLNGHRIILMLRQRRRRDDCYKYHPMLYGEQKIAQFRPHDSTKELAYVSTQIPAKLDTYI